MPKADKSLRQYLSENIEHLSLDDTVQVLSDITQAIVAIEGRVVHRDIKPDNILLLDGQMVSCGLWNLQIRGSHHGT